MAGISNGFDSFVVRGNPESEKFSVFYFRDGVLVAAESVPGDHLSARKLISQHARSSPPEASDLSVTLKTLLEKHQPVEAGA